MLMPQDFISGFASAIHSLGREGDQRSADWSAPYEYLKQELGRFKPEEQSILTRLRSRRRAFGDLADDAAAEIEKLRELVLSAIEENPDDQWRECAKSVVLNLKSEAK